MEARTEPGYVTIIKAAVARSGRECILAVETDGPMAPSAVRAAVAGACREWAASNAGKAVLGGRGMDWKDFAIHLPDEVAVRHGFRKVRTCGVIECELGEDVLAMGSERHDKPESQGRIHRAWPRLGRKAAGK